MIPSVPPSPEHAALVERIVANSDDYALRSDLAFSFCSVREQHNAGFKTAQEPYEAADKLVAETQKEYVIMTHCGVPGTDMEPTWEYTVKEIKGDFSEDAQQGWTFYRFVRP